MGLVDFLALIFAHAAVVDVWRNGSIFATGRAYMEAKADADPEDDEDDGVETAFSLWLLIPRPIAELLNCPYCLSHHTPWVLAVAFLFTATLVVEPWSFLLKLPVYSLAATRIGNIINEMVPEGARYRRSETDFLDEDDDELEPESGGSASEP